MVALLSCLSFFYRVYTIICKYTPRKHRRSTNVELMLGHRRRRWSNSKSTLFQRLVFVDYSEHVDHVHVKQKRLILFSVNFTRGTRFGVGQGSGAQQTRGIHPMLFQCWTNVEDGGPTLKQHWVNSPCFQGVGVGVSIPIYLYSCF